MARLQKGVKKKRKRKMKKRKPLIYEIAPGDYFYVVGDGSAHE